MRISALPIRHLLLAAFLLTSLLPTTLVTGLAFYEARTALKVEIQRDLATRADATADYIDRMMFERLQNVASWGRLEIMQDARINDVDKRLSMFLHELKDSYRHVYRTLYVLNHRGVVVASSDAALLGRQFALQPLWEDTSPARNHVRIAQPADGILQISTEIRDTVNDDTTATLVAEFNWQEITDVLEGAVVGRTSAALLDDHGKVIAATALWHSAASRHLSATAPTQGFQGLTSHNWQVVFSQHRKEAMAPIERMGWIFIGLLLATILLTSFIALPVARSISRPLQKLTEFASRFIRSPSNVRPPSGGPAEVNALSQAFTRMIEDLELSNAHLTRAAKLAVVGEMAAAMSHEVRTPLGILRSSAQVLLREPTLSEEGREVCGFIISETARLNKIVSTLIDAARPRQPEFRRADVTELAQQAVAMLRTQAEKKSISLELDAAGPVMLACDSELLLQALLNLLLNAIQILPADGHIQVSVRQDADHVRILVADDGPGVAPAQREQIFDPFFTKRPGGIGLGLTVVRQIVVAHQGEITVGSSAAGGAEFCLQLPVNKEASEQ